MSKTTILEKIEAGWQEIFDIVKNESELQIIKKTSENSWSIKDILGHVSTWEHEALVCLPVILRGEKPKSYRRDYGGIDAFNALKIRQKANMPLNLVLAEFQAVHLQLMDNLHTIPEEEYKSGTRFMRRLGWDTFKHYPEHAQIIRALLRNQENQVDI